MVTDAVAACIRPGDHGTTFGGNPFVAAAAQVVFRRVADAGFLAASCERGAQLARGVRAIAAAHPALVAEVRSPLDSGLFVGVQLAVGLQPVAAALQRGLLLITAVPAAQHLRRRRRLWAARAARVL